MQKRNRYDLNLATTPFRPARCNEHQSLATSTKSAMRDFISTSTRGTFFDCRLMHQRRGERTNQAASPSTRPKSHPTLQRQAHQMKYLCRCRFVFLNKRCHSSRSNSGSRPVTFDAVSLRDAPFSQWNSSRPQIFCVCKQGRRGVEVSIEHEHLHHVHVCRGRRTSASGGSEQGSGGAEDITVSAQARRGRCIGTYSRRARGWIRSGLRSHRCGTGGMSASGCCGREGGSQRRGRRHAGIVRHEAKPWHARIRGTAAWNCERCKQ